MRGGRDPWHAVPAPPPYNAPVARLDLMSELERKSILSIPCPTFPDTPPRPGPPLHERRVAIVSTAGLHLRHNPPFSLRTAGDDASRATTASSRVTSPPPNS